MKYDRGMYPPIETGGNDPMLAIGALLFGLGGAINPAVMAEPEVFARVCERLSDYRPEAASGDDPGYRFAREEGFDIEAVASAFDKERTTYLATMADLSYLLSQPDYGAAFRTLQRSSPGGAGGPPSESEVEKALETMRRLQEETGRQGVI